MGRGGAVETSPAGRVPRRDGTTLFATRPGVSASECKQTLEQLRLEHWYVVENADGAWIARDLGVALDVIAEELGRLGDEWRTDKGPA
jgi:hypothetical protein